MGMMIVRGDGPETLDRETVLEVVERLLGKDDDDLYDMLADHVSRVVNLHERIMARDVAKVRNYMADERDLGAADFAEVLRLAQARETVGAQAVDEDSFPDNIIETLFELDGGWRCEFLPNREAIDAFSSGFAAIPKTEMNWSKKKVFGLRDPDGVARAVFGVDGVDIQNVYGRSLGSVEASVAPLVDKAARILGPRLEIHNTPTKEAPLDLRSMRKDGSCYFLKDGVFDRADGPAITKPSGGTPGEEEWLVDGRRHRDGGLPAITRSGGKYAYCYVDGLRSDPPGHFNADDPYASYRNGNRIPAPLWENHTAIAKALFVAAKAPPQGRKFRREAQVAAEAAFDRNMTLFARRLAKTGSTSWTAEADAIAATFPGTLESKRERTLFAKCQRFGRLMALGEFDAIQTSERRSLLRMLALVPERFAPRLRATPTNGLTRAMDGDDGLAQLVRRVEGAAVPVAEAESGPAPFKAPFARTVRGRQTARPAWTRGSVLLEPVDAGLAQTVAVLARPDGGTLELREFDGSLYRPVLTPDCWIPIGEADFRAAVRDGVAWRDNPLMPRPDHDDNARSAAEMAEPLEDVKPSEIIEAQAAAAEAIHACLARAGRLIVVDGVVHKPTMEPTVAIVATEAYDGHGKNVGNGCDRRHLVEWRLGSDLAMTDSQSTILLDSDRYAVRDAGLDDFSLGGISRPSRAVETPPGLEFPAAELATAEAVLDEWARTVNAAGLSDFIIAAARPSEPVVRLAGGGRAGGLSPMIDAVASSGQWRHRPRRIEGLQGAANLALAWKDTGAAKERAVEAFAELVADLDGCAEVRAAGDLATRHRGDERPMPTGLLAALAKTLGEALREPDSDAVDDEQISTGFSAF